MTVNFSITRPAYVLVAQPHEDGDYTQLLGRASIVGVFNSWAEARAEQKWRRQHHPRTPPFVEDGIVLPTSNKPISYIVHHSEVVA